MSAIEEIKQKADILELVGQTVQLTKSGRTFRAPCPFHNEKKPSFFVYPEQQTWHCFGACNTGGDIFSFVMKREGLDFGDALRLLADKYGVVLPSQAKSEAEDRARERIFQINQSASQFFQNLLLNSPAADFARRYLGQRGLNEKSISDFQLGYSLPGWEQMKNYLSEKGYSEEEMLSAGLVIRDEKQGQTHDRFHHHLMFPISDERGRITGFGARVLDDSSPKYINSPQTRVFDKSGTLYGLHLAKSAIREKNLAVMVEGYMDVIVAHQYGFNNVVAPMGVAITEKQINQIKKLSRNIALALDPDAAGEEAAMRCVSYENALDAEVKVITLPPGQDPDEVIKADKAKWQEAVDKARPVIEFSIAVITSHLDLKTTSGKTEAVNKVLPIISATKAGPRQHAYLTQLSLAVGIDEKKLEAALGRLAAPDRKARESRPQAVQKATRPLASNPIEEYALAILIHHPELKGKVAEIPLDYFENTENKDILVNLLRCGESEDIKGLLDPALHQHFETLQARELPGEQMEDRLEDCSLRLRERYLRNLQRRNTELLAAEKESNENPTVAELEEQIIKTNQELHKIFALRAKPHGEIKK